MDSEAEFQLQPSSSVEALELLLGAGLDRVQQPTSCLEQTHRPRGPLLKIMAGIRDPPRDRQWSKATTSRLRITSSSIREMLAKFGERLDSLTARVEGSDSSSSMPSEVSQMSEPSILTWPDEESGEDPSARPLISVLESTAKTLRSAFKKPLSNTTRLLVRKPYSYSEACQLASQL